MPPMYYVTVWKGLLSQCSQWSADFHLRLETLTWLSDSIDLFRQQCRVSICTASEAETRALSWSIVSGKCIFRILSCRLERAVHNKVRLLRIPDRSRRPVWFDFYLRIDQIFEFYLRISNIWVFLRISNIRHQVGRGSEQQLPLPVLQLLGRFSTNWYSIENHNVDKYFHWHPFEQKALTVSVYQNNLEFSILAINTLHWDKLLSSSSAQYLISRSICGQNILSYSFAKKTWRGKASMQRGARFSVKTML